MFYCCCILTATAIATCLLFLNKVWWAPMFGFVQNLGWMAFWAMRAETRPIMFLAALYAVLYTIYIPRWARDRKRPADDGKPSRETHEGKIKKGGINVGDSSERPPMEIPGQG